MSNAWTAPVNRELYVATAHLRLLPEGNSANERRLCQGLLESALFHLVVAHRTYLRELAANYELPAAEQATTLESLEKAFAAADKEPGELAELLKQGRTGWLAELLTAFDAALTPDSGGITAAPTDSGRIVLRDLGSQPTVALSKERISAWIESYRELIERHRAIMVEY